MHSPDAGKGFRDGVEAFSPARTSADDGPHPYYTEQLLKGLKERDVKATFFITGKNVEMYPEIVKKIHQEGASVIQMTLPQYLMDRITGHA